MALKKFIGARYAPQFMGEWNQASEYAALSVVYTENRSYVSRKAVPAGTLISNQEYWIQSSDWNAQVAQYNQKVDAYNTNVEKYNKNVEDYEAAVSTFYADTLHSYDTKADMQADKTLKLGETLLTCGGSAIGDGGGSFYQVVDSTSVTAVALDNGLFAEPFEFQPYDYSQFQTEVENYKKSTTRVYENVSAMVADAGIDTGDTLMTNGRNTAGDGKGRFWTVSDEASGNSQRLNNGKYATPFQLASVETANMLYFNGSGAQPAIYGIKEGSEAITIPMVLEEGDIKTVYVAVEYTTGGKGATVNLDVSGTQSFGTSFAFNESASASGTYKTVLYAITGKAEGGNVYTGYSTVTSYVTTLTKYSEGIQVGIPDISNPVWNSRRELTAVVGTNHIALINGFTVTKNIKLSAFTINTTGEIQVPLTAYIIDRTDSVDINNIVGSKSTVTATANGTTVSYAGTFTPDAELSVGKTYTIVFEYTLTNSSQLSKTILIKAGNTTGNFGPFTMTKNFYYSGIVTYTDI